jgi:hypothetical protein
MCGPRLSTKIAVMTTPITFRHSTELDRPVLLRLAELDSARPFEGPAVSLDEHRAIADPFQPTAEVVDLLWSWATQARAA